MEKDYQKINKEAFEMNKTKEDNFSNREILYYLEEMISMGTEKEYELKAYQDIKECGKVKHGHLKKIKRNMYKLHNEKF